VVLKECDEICFSYPVIRKISSRRVLFCFSANYTVWRKYDEKSYSNHVTGQRTGHLVGPIRPLTPTSPTHRPLRFRKRASKADSSRDTNPQVGNCNVCQVVGKSSILASSRKQKLHIKLQPRKPKDENSQCACFSLKVRDITHPSRITRKINFFYILIFILLDKRL
jgi:hypothetical protein